MFIGIGSLAASPCARSVLHKTGAHIVNALKNRYISIFELGSFAAQLKRGVSLLLNCVNYKIWEQPLYVGAAPCMF